MRKKPNIQIKPFKRTKKDIENAKLLTKIMEHMYTDEDFERMKRQAELLNRSIEANPHGLICINWCAHKEK